MPPSNTHPRHPTHLVGSKWSRVGEDLDFRHFEVSTFSKKTGELVLFAVLDRATKTTIPWRQLRDRDLWEPGWV